jgi:hypothetical protein
LNYAGKDKPTSWWSNYEELRADILEADKTGWAHTLMSRPDTSKQIKRVERQPSGHIVAIYDDDYFSNTAYPGIRLVDYILMNFAESFNAGADHTENVDGLEGVIMWMWLMSEVVNPKNIGYNFNRILMQPIWLTGTGLYVENVAGLPDGYIYGEDGSSLNNPETLYGEASFEAGAGYPLAWVLTMDDFDQFVFTQTAATISANGFTYPDDFNTAMFINKYTQY